MIEVYIDPGKCCVWLSYDGTELQIEGHKMLESYPDSQEIGTWLIQMARLRNNLQYQLYKLVYGSCP